jgi:squalene synthase HpnC
VSGVELLEAAPVLARARGENFPVASRWLPAAARRQLLAIYGFARLADELGDEAPGDRDALLDALERELDAIYAGAEPRHPLLRRLAAAVRELGLPREPFARLIRANRLDQRVARYPSFAALLAYCADSANPVGRLVLRVFGADTPERRAWSDAVCSGLQIVEHCQDVVEDRVRGRIYLPREDLERFGCSEAELAGAPAPPRVRDLLRFEVGRARALLERGVPLGASLRGRPRLAVAGFVAGGLSAADAIARCGYDVSRGAPAVRRRDLLRNASGVLRRARRLARGR